MLLPGQALQQLFHRLAADRVAGNFDGGGTRRQPCQRGEFADAPMISRSRPGMEAQPGQDAVEQRDLKTIGTKNPEGRSGAFRQGAISSSSERSSAARSGSEEERSIAARRATQNSVRIPAFSAKNWKYSPRVRIAVISGSAFT